MRTKNQPLELVYTVSPEDGETSPLGAECFEWPNDSTDYGIATVLILGVSFHLEAIAVTLIEDDLWAVDGEFQEKLEVLTNQMSDYRFSTVGMNDKSYVLVMTPYDA